MSFFGTPSGMTRRHFLSHLAGASAMALPAYSLTSAVRVHANDLQKRNKSAILLWMNGGPSTIDLWDLKPGAPTGGPFKPISTTGEGQICEHLPLLAQQMKHLAIVRSMSTREADHDRGRYYMHTGYVPNPSVEHPSYGSVISHELIDKVPHLEIPPFISVGGGSVGPGFLGMAYAPFVVNSNGDVRNLDMRMENNRIAQRRYLLNQMTDSFAKQNRGDLPGSHRQVLDKTWKMMSSKQVEAFRVTQESAETREMYGNNSFGRGCLIARRLVEVGVPFIEVDLGGWDNHSRIFPTLQDQKLPEMDKAMSALVADLEQRGRLQDTMIIWMGEFGRTPRINGDAGRDHWARSWSVVLGGCGIQGGKVVGSTNEDGTQVVGEAFSSQDLMATVCQGLGISLETTFQTPTGRPMKIANSGKVITDLFG